MGNISCSILEVFLDQFAQRGLIHFNGFTAFYWMDGCPVIGLARLLWRDIFFFFSMLCSHKERCSDVISYPCVYLFFFKSGIAESILIVMDVAKSSFFRGNFILFNRSIVNVNI